MTTTVDIAQLRRQYELHKLAFDLARERLRDEVRKHPDHAEREAAEAAFKQAMTDLDLDIDLLWHTFSESEIATGLTTR